MQLSSLRVYQLRNLEDITLTPVAGLNVITGPNASGKTALLEAIYLLARGRSFRTHRIRELIRHNQDRLQVTARIREPSGREAPVGLERDRRQTRLRYDGASVRNLSEHARRLPLVLITPDSHMLINGSPVQRRRWLDWAMFHVEPAYLACWQDCFHALRQRNTLLRRSGPADQLASWEQALAEYSTRLDALREGFVQKLSFIFEGLIGDLLASEGGVRYQPGHDAAMDYGSQLAAARNRDRERGFTQAGPHRSDLFFEYRAMEARAILSRGQAKLYIAGLMLAFARMLVTDGLSPLILVDDLPAELDENARHRFMTALAAVGGQAFVTAIEPDMPADGWSAVCRFHVEQGCRAEVIQ
ncbi:MAG: DNA replication/repair protein RecF [Gammaproteobacteria bacterium]|nr:DNA replication/repair protein RecF [Gammaproteobacteria bacterium]